MQIDGFAIDQADLPDIHLTGHLGVHGKIPYTFQFVVRIGTDPGSDHDPELLLDKMRRESAARFWGSAIIKNGKS